MPTGVYIRSQSIIDNMRIKMRGNTSHLGFKLSERQKENLSKSHIGIQREENNPSWKGDKAGYVALHKWIRRKMGNPTYCSNNIKHGGRFEWANISGEYKRDIKDWHQLCHSCNKLDGVKKHKRFLIK
jgi:hypothetical protein